MALLFMESFDHAASGGATPSKWLSASLPAGLSYIAGRTGGSAISLASGNLVSKTYSTSGGAVVGVAFNLGGLTAADLIQVLETAIVHVAVGVTTGGLLTVKRGATVLATGTTVLAAGSWYYLELKTVIHDTAGTFEVRLDGVAEPNLTASSQDTQNAGTGVWNRAAIANHRFDDFYLCDTSSAIRNDFLGAIKIENLMPQTGNGTNVGLTCSTGTDHGALVDETPPNTTDYNSSATVGTKDTYNLPSMTGTGVILGIQTNLYAAKSDAGARQVCAVIRHGGADYDGANVSPLTTFGYFCEVRAQTPGGSPADWTSADVNALEAGMKVTV